MHSKKEYPGDILIVRNDRLGDMLLALPTVSLLRSLYPSKNIHFWANPANADIIRCVSGIKQVVLSPDSWSPSVIDELKKLSIGRAYCFRATFANARALKQAGIPVRVGTSRRWYSCLFSNRINLSRRGSTLHEADLNLLMVDRNRTLSDAGFPSITVPVDVIETVNRLLIEHGVKNHERIITIHPGSGGSAREWPTLFFRELSDRLLRTKKIRVIVTGGSNEIDKCREVANNHHPNLAGETSLLELTAIMLRSDLIIANSTGPLHLAVALGRKVLGLYPPVKDCLPGRWGPFRHPEWALKPDLPLCRKCKPGKVSSCACMDSLTPDTVFDKAITILR